MSKELGIEIAQRPGRYGEFTVLVDGEAILDGGPLGWLGILPTADEVLRSLRARLIP